MPSTTPSFLHAPSVLHFTRWLLMAMTVIPALAMAGTEEIVGTWRRPDRSTVEFKTDGVVALESGPVGTWERLKSSPKFILRFTGARDFYYVTIGGYKRQLTMELQSRGLKTTLERIDNGPTQNLDVPDEKTALQMESLDLQTEMSRLSIQIDAGKKEAAMLWERYYEGRFLGRATAMNLEAQKKDNQVKGMELHLVDLRKRATILSSKLGGLK